MAQLRVPDATVREWFPHESETERTGLVRMAIAYIDSRCTVPDGEYPADLQQAVRLLVARHIARRNSPDGTLGMSEFGVGRIATVDRDIEAMLAPYRRVVFG